MERLGLGKKPTDSLAMRSSGLLETLLVYHCVVGILSVLNEADVDCVSELGWNDTNLIERERFGERVVGLHGWKPDRSLDQRCSNKPVAFFSAWSPCL